MAPVLWSTPHLHRATTLPNGSFSSQPVPETQILLWHFPSFTSVSVQSLFRTGLVCAQENTAVVSVIPSDVYTLTMQLILETMIHTLLPPSWVAFMAAFIASIYLFRKCHFKNINLKTRKQLRRKIERVLLWNEFNKLYFRACPLFQIYFSEWPSTCYPKK